MKFLAGASILAVAASAMPTSLGERDVCNAARSVSIVVDSSASNRGTDPANLRLAASTDVINGLNFQQDRVSVVSFNEKSTLRYPLGQDKDAALRAIREIDARGNTKISEGLAAGLDQIINLGQDARDQAGIVVFTDGLDSTKAEQLKLLQRAKEAGIRVNWGHLTPDQVSTKGKRDLGLEERTFGIGKNILSSVISMFCGIRGGGSTSTGSGSGSTNVNVNTGSGSTGGQSNIIVRPSTPLDQEISHACLSTGGTVSIIGNANAQQSFIQQVIKNGVTNNEGRCSGLDIDQSGGPVKNNVTSLGLCSNNANAEFTYTPEKVKEKLAFTVSLVSTANKVSLKAVFENTANGAKNEILVNSQNPSLMLTGEAAPGELVKVTIQPNGASPDSCQYSVGLIAVADELVQSASSSLVIEGTLIEQGTIVGQQSGYTEEQVSKTVSQTASEGTETSQTVSVSEGTASSATVSQTASSEYVSQTASSASSATFPTDIISSATASSTASSATVSSASSGTVSSATFPSDIVSSGTASSGTVSSATSSATVSSATSASVSECPTPPAASTVTETKTETVTGPAASATAGNEICLCKCDVKGAKPFPKVNEL